MQKKITKIGIFFPARTSFYVSLLEGITKGLRSFDVEVFGDCSLYQEEQFTSFCKEFKPDVVFEMNRTRCQAPFIPKKIIHIAWIVDTNGQPSNVFQESEIIYFFGVNWMHAHDNTSCSLTDVLSPGVCPEHYYPEKRPVQCDFSLVGHIPRPWNANELARPVANKEGSSLYFEHLVTALQKHLHQIDTIGFTNDHYLQLTEDIASKMGYALDTLELDTTLRYDLGCRSIREFYRHQLIDLILAHQYNIRLYGPENWQQWEKYAPFYHGLLHGPDKMRTVYQTSRINLHEGVGLHFRTFDCLASGGVLFFMQGYDDDKHGGIQSTFEPFRHFVPFNKNTFYSVAERYLHDNRKCSDMSQIASEETLTNHSWRCRWEKIFFDIKQL